MAGIYIHIPFCKQACHYCDFHFSTNRELERQMTTAICDELTMQKGYLNSQLVNTIYLGGGTPSILEDGSIREILERQSLFTISNNPEITLEANPDDLIPDKLNNLKGAGINRLSIGIQSFDDNVLRYFNRPHTGVEAVQSIDAARTAGFNNISIDLIYAIPGMTMKEWQSTIRQALELEPEHISAYALTIEPKTVFGVKHKRGVLKPVDEDVAAEHLECLVDLLGSNGYEHYEVSNFSRPGFESRHNSSYWKQEHYLGIGPSAHSYNGTSRQFNISNNPLYIRSIQAGKIPYEIENLSVEDHVNEYLLTTLRTNWGSDLNLLSSRFQYDILSVHAAFIDNLVRSKYAVVEGSFLKLTRSGRLLADKIAADLFLDKPGKVV